MPNYLSYRINFHSDGKIRGCLHYTASFRIELILPLQKQVLTAVIYWNIFKKTMLSRYYNLNCYRALPGQCFRVNTIQIDENLYINIALSEGTVNIVNFFVRNIK